ncbi:MAG: DUF2064 domain-containing protein, partial [Candidatus Dadabacteria bacterium]
VVIGSDCPLLSLETLQSAIDSINRGESVLGPALQGGIYLFGVPKGVYLDYKDIFSGDSKEAYLFCNAMSNAGKKVNILNFYPDIDLPEDVELLASLLKAASLGKGCVKPLFRIPPNTHRVLSSSK